MSLPTQIQNTLEDIEEMKNEWYKTLTPDRQPRNLEVVSVFYSKVEDGLPKYKYAKSNE